MFRPFVLLLLLIPAPSAVAAVKLPFVFTHHMVLQRGAAAPVWGEAEPGETVTVRFGDQQHETTADDDGRWRVDFDPLSPGGPRELVVTGSDSDDSIRVRDVLVGDVWICSGQSNMQWPLERSRDAALDLMTADRPKLRLLEVDQLGCQEPLADIDQAWSVCTRESAGQFSAVGYHFGVQLQESLEVPIGLIRTAWGGSACEAWAPLARLEDEPAAAPYLAEWEKKGAKYDEAALRAEHAKRLAEFYEARDAAYAAGEPLPQRPWVNNELFHQNRPANLYNARVASLVPFAIKGVIWYQGESNAGRSYAYREVFPLTIQSWRDAWGQGDFPFYWVQLADFKPEVEAASQESGWAELREAQTMTLDRLPNVGEAVIVDLGEANDIHPRNKRDVGLRLARLALDGAYGKSIKGASARYESVAFEEGSAVVTFSNAGGGLTTFDGGAPTGFALADEDRVFHAAEAEIVDKNRVELSSPDVDEPVAVRYAWADNPRVNLYDSAWLPVTPFRTDNWPGVTAPKGD